MDEKASIQLRITRLFEKIGDLQAEIALLDDQVRHLTNQYRLLNFKFEQILKDLPDDKEIR